MVNYELCLWMQILGYADYAFTSIFTVEILLKVRWSAVSSELASVCDADTISLPDRWRYTEPSSIRAPSAGTGSTCWTYWWSASHWFPSSCSQYLHLLFFFPFQQLGWASACVRQFDGKTGRHRWHQFSWRFKLGTKMCFAELSIKSKINIRSGPWLYDHEPDCWMC